MNRTRSFIALVILLLLGQATLAAAQGNPDCIFDPWGLPTQNGFTADGNPALIGVTPGPSLDILDANPGFHLGFYCSFAPSIPGELEVVVTSRIDSAHILRPERDGDIQGDTGARAGFTDGEFQYMLALVEPPTNHVRRVAIPLNGGVSPGIRLDWTLPFTASLRRNAAGDAELRVGGVTETISRGLLPPSIRAGAAIEFGAFGANDLDGVFSSMIRQRVGAFIVLPDQALSSLRARIAQLAAQSRLPWICERKESALEGGLMSYGIRYSDMYRPAATYVDKILKGAKPADLPIEQPTKFEFIIDLRTAKSLGLTIPPSLLAGADELIQ